MKISKLLSASLLFDAYGKLLTTTQQKYFVDYFFNDLTLEEIAQKNKISKPAIYDSLKQANASLQHYETKVGYVKEFKSRSKIYKKHNNISAIKQLVELERL